MLPVVAHPSIGIVFFLDVFPDKFSDVAVLSRNAEELLNDIGIRSDVEGDVELPEMFLLPVIPPFAFPPPLELFV